MRTLLLLALLVVVSPSVAAQEPTPTPTDAPTAEPTPTEPSPGEPTAPPAPADNTTPAPPQDFSTTDQSHAGAYIAFSYPGGAFELDNVTYSNETFLTALHVNASQPTPSDGDATFTLDSPEASLSVQDGESAGAQLVARADVRIDLVLAPDVSFAATDDGSVQVTGLEGRLLDIEAGPNASIRWDAPTRVIHVEASPADTEALVLRFSTASSDPIDAHAAQAFGNGTLGGEVTVSDRRAVTTDYGDMHLTASVTPDQAIVIVQAASHAPRVVLVKVLAGALGAGNVTVLLDGERVDEARTVAEAFDPANLTRPEYVIVSSSTETQVVVALPHLSSHTIQIQSLRGGVPIVVDPRAPFIVLGALTGTAILGFLLIRRR